MSNLRAEGQYIGQLVEWNVSPAKSTSTTQMVLCFKLADESKAIAYLPITDKTMTTEDGRPGFAARALAKLEFNGDFAAPEFGKTNDIELYCKHNEYNNKVSEKWTISDFERRPASDDAIAQANRMYRAVIGTPAKPTAKPAAPAAPARPAAAPTRQAPPARDKSKKEELPPLDRNRAYTEFLDRKKGDNDFFNAIDKVVADSGVAEEQFNEDHWELVVKVIDPEFVNAPF